MLSIWSKFLTGLDFVSLNFVYLVYVGRKMAFNGLGKIQKGPQLNSMPKICCLFENLPVNSFTFTAIHSADKFSNEQQILGLALGSDVYSVRLYFHEISVPAGRTVVNSKNPE